MDAPPIAICWPKRLPVVSGDARQATATHNALGILRALPSSGTAIAGRCFDVFRWCDCIGDEHELRV